MPRHTAFDTNCPMARVTEILGEGWTLLILREAFMGTRQFNVFERELGIARNILSARLNRLVETGILERQRSEADRRVVEYRLSRAGKALFPILVGLTQWAGEWLDEGEPPVRFVEAATGEELPMLELHNRRGKPLGPRDVLMRPGPAADARLRERYERVGAGAE